VRFEAHLRQDSHARAFIERPGEDPWDRLFHFEGCCEEAVDWLIARRAAELGIAG